MIYLHTNKLILDPGCSMLDPGHRTLNKSLCLKLRALCVLRG